MTAFIIALLILECFLKWRRRRRDKSALATTPPNDAREMDTVDGLRLTSASSSVAPSHPRLGNPAPDAGDTAACFHSSPPLRPPRPTLPVPFLKRYETPTAASLPSSAESHRNHVQPRLERQPRVRVGGPTLSSLGLPWRATQQQIVATVPTSRTLEPTRPINTSAASSDNQPTHRSNVDDDVLLDQRQVTETLRTLTERLNVLDRPPAYREE